MIAGYRSAIVCAPDARWKTWLLKSVQSMRPRLIEFACITLTTSLMYSLAMRDAPGTCATSGVGDGVVGAVDAPPLHADTKSSATRQEAARLL